MRFLVKSQKIFQTFSAGNNFYCFNSSWNVRFSDRLHFILITLFFLEKGHILYSRINSREKYSYFKFFCFTAWEYVPLVNHQYIHSYVWWENLYGSFLTPCADLSAHSLCVYTILRSEDSPVIWICNLHHQTRWLWKIIFDSNTWSIYWCQFFWFKPKLLWHRLHWI